MNDEIKVKLKYLADLARNTHRGSEDLNKYIDSISKEISDLFTEMVEGELRGFGKWFGGNKGQFDHFIEQYLLERKK